MNNRKLLLDTNILIDFLKGHEKAVEFISQSKQALLISAITVAELYSGVRGRKEETAIEDLLMRFQVIPVSSPIARNGGLLKKEYAKSHGVGIADAVIAATAILENAELNTLHIKHFPMLDFKELPY